MASERIEREREERGRELLRRMDSLEIELDQCRSEFRRLVNPRPAVSHTTAAKTIQRKGTVKKRAVLTDEELETGILKALNHEVLSFSKMIKRFHVSFNRVKEIITQMEKRGQVRKFIGNYMDENGKPRPGWGYTLPIKVIGKVETAS